MSSMLHPSKKRVGIYWSIHEIPTIQYASVNCSGRTTFPVPGPCTGAGTSMTLTFRFSSQAECSSSLKALAECSICDVDGWTRLSMTT
eukprot:7485752-Pyramimonas_sp.AAC.1